VLPDVDASLDDRILSLLRENGRATYAAIASEIGLSAHAVAERVRRLERRGVIKGYRAIIDHESLGRTLEAFVDVRLLPTTDPDAFERLATRLDSALQVIFVTGRFDFLVHLACHDAEELDQAVRQLRARGGVAATETRIVMRRGLISPGRS
jgi:Lrp/AsnC family transcriptional regulator, leucine-responsive regulatory protein